MVINHKYRFIFIKTRKTAGTSIEIALSRFCDPGDILTAISQEDEAKRHEFGFTGPQNYLIPFSYYGKKDFLRLAWQRRRKQFANHSSAAYVCENVDKRIWSSYFKFCFERSPYDKAISRYYWSTREPRPSIDSYLDSVPASLLSNWNLYTLNDHIAVDFVGQYENLTDDLAAITDRIGLPSAIELPSAKAKYRANREHYTKVLNARARARIEVVCAKEIAKFGYRWKSNHTTGHHSELAESVPQSPRAGTR